MGESAEQGTSGNISNRRGAEDRGGQENSRSTLQRAVLEELLRAAEDLRDAGASHPDDPVFIRFKEASDQANSALEREMGG